MLLYSRKGFQLTLQAHTQMQYIEEYQEGYAHLKQSLPYNRLRFPPYVVVSS